MFAVRKAAAYKPVVYTAAVACTVAYRGFVRNARFFVVAERIGEPQPARLAAAIFVVGQLAVAQSAGALVVHSVAGQLRVGQSGALDAGQTQLRAGQTDVIRAPAKLPDAGQAQLRAEQTDVIQDLVKPPAAVRHVAG